MWQHHNVGTIDISTNLHWLINKIIQCSIKNLKKYKYLEVIVHCYSLIAFDERVTFWLQRVRSLPCVWVYDALFAHRLAYNHYAIAHAYNAANKHAQGSDPARWSQKVTLSLKAIRVYNVNNWKFGLSCDLWTNQYLVANLLK